MSFSNYLENYLLNYLFTTETVYVGYGSAATEASMTELSGSGYARVAYGAWSLTSVGVDVQEVTNDAAVTFPVSTGSQGTCAVIGFFDALTGGNFLGSVTLAELGLDDISVITGTQIIIAINKCICRLD
jgi:hypothetical protein